MTTAVAPRTVEQAAADLNVSKYTIRGWVSRRVIGHIKIGRMVRIPQAEIQRLLDTGTVPAKRLA
jgi:excisionase family DNA binding protein